jgi:penicillin amidase
VHLVAPELDVAGGAYVGGPVVQVGRNRRGAWSVTNLTADDVDPVLERLDPAGAHYATADGHWEPLTLRQCEIPVRFGEPYRLTVRSTCHGPLLDALSPVTGITPRMPVALEWKGVLDPGHSLAGWLAVNRSRGLDDVLAAAPAFDRTPFQGNCIYADVEGRIAHLVLGALPRRVSPIGCLPALGWRGEGAWQGFGSLGATPWRVDPAEGAVWTANEATGAADRVVGGDGQPFGEHPYRARRIRAVLEAGVAHTVADFARLQVDDLDLSACANLPALRAALAAWEPRDPLVRHARDLLLGWDGRAAAGSAGAAIYHVLLFAEWIPLLVPDDLCAGFARHWRVATWVAEAVLRAPRSPWFPDEAAKTAALAGCATRAVERLRVLAGEDAAAWRWGDLHRVRFAHPLAFAPRFAAGGLAPVALGGSPFAVNQQRLGSSLPPFGAAVGAGVRMVVDLARPDELHIVLSTGQSGDPESPHFADHLPRWLAGELYRVPLAAVEAESETVLQPSDARA